MRFLPDMQPKLSVIIPCYNGSRKLAKLLASLQRSRYKNFEVIVVDDGSSISIKHQLSSFVSRVTYHIFFITSSPNRGPAIARNKGAKAAKGRILVFFDCDVTVYPDTLTQIAQAFASDPDLTALTGVWDKFQRTRAFFPQFKALRDWSYWINERDSSGYYYLFSTRVCAIRKEVFVRLGGFNERFLQMEDVEITYRIARRYAIIFAPEVRVHHEFEGFLPVARKYFWRSYYWSSLYAARRKFDPVATTMRETLAAATGVGAVGCIVLGLFLAGASMLFGLSPYGLVLLSTLNYQLSAIVMMFHIFFLRKFLLFVYREKGFVFTVQSLFTGLMLYCVIVSGALYYQMRKRI